MSQVSRTTSKAYFNTGDVPTETEFANTLDSVLWYDDPLVIQTAKTNDYTLVLTDANTEIPMDKATAITLTIPLNSSVAFPIGTIISAPQINVGQLTIAATGGVTMNYASGLAPRARTQYSQVWLKKRGTDSWDITGDLESTQYITACLSSNATANTTTTVAKITGLDKVCDVGTYTFRYVIIAQSATATVSMKFAVNHTGTTTKFIYNLFFPSAGVTAATGVVDQEVNATTGQVWAFQGTRIKNTTLGPMTDVDTINSDIMFIIEGVMVVTVSGTLELYHASETATSTQVMADSSVEIKKMR